MQSIVILWLLFCAGVWTSYWDRRRLNREVINWAMSGNFTLDPDSTVIEDGKTCHVRLIDEAGVCYSSVLKVRGFWRGSFLDAPKVLALDKLPEGQSDRFEIATISGRMRLLVATFGVAIGAMLFHSWSAYQDIPSGKSWLISPIAVGSALLISIKFSWPYLVRRSQVGSSLSLHLASLVKDLAFGNILYLGLAIFLPFAHHGSPLKVFLFFAPAFLLPRVPGSLLAEAFHRNA